MDGKEILLMPDVLLVGSAKETFAEGKIIDGVEDIGFPRPVEAHETIDILRQLQIRRFTVLEVGQFEFVEIHFLLILNDECGMRNIAMRCWASPPFSIPNSKFRILI